MSPRNIGRVDPRARNPEAHEAPEPIAAEYAVQSLLQALVEGHQPKRVLELGTGNGYSAAAIIEVLPAASEFVTVEANPGRHQVAQRRIEDAFDDRAADSVDRGDPWPWVPSVSPLLERYEAERSRWKEFAPFDLVFVDAEWTARAEEVSLVLPYLSPGAILVLHDMGDASPGRAAIPAIRDMGFDVIEVWTPRGVAIAQIPPDLAT